MIKSLTTLIFDLDGTLCKYGMELEEGLSRTFSGAGEEELPFGRDEYEDGFGVEFDKAIDGTIDRPELEFRTRIFLNLLSETTYDETEIIELGTRFAAIREDSLTLFEEVPETLEKLTKRFKLGLLTNGPSNLQRRKIEELSLEGQFDSVIVSGEHDMAKPDPEIFHVALEDLKSEPENSVYIGNSLQYDVLGANRANIPVIWRDNGAEEKLEEPSPDMVINDLSDLFSANRKNPDRSEREKRRIKT